MTRRRVLAFVLVAFVLAGAVLLLLDRRDEPGVPVAGLDPLVTEYAAGLRADAPYRPPTNRETDALWAALRSTDHSGLADLGYTSGKGTDAATGRDYTLFVNRPGGDRGWGLYLVDASRPTRLVIEVPHPNFDLRTEQIGLNLFRRVPGSVLAIAGTHRGAANGAGDVAHRTDSMFHGITAKYAELGLPQVQLHGFDDDSLPDSDIVVSPGAADPRAPVRRVADDLDETSLRVCRAWKEDCGRLAGRNNVQGNTAAELSTVFVHVEISRDTRDSESGRDKVAAALAEADPATP
ncbi:hypothetical protein [Actinokineospora sp. HUAS TT18]|uniref:hypothetical protein n=1 Tax=Actinokineospora sp. HUAS TT18 TaxID=3447451 RepID=UPI003F521FAF